MKRTPQPHTIAGVEIQPGTLYPGSEWLHIRRHRAAALTTLNELVNTCAGPEICNRLYGYEDGTLLF